ncbi:5-(carboxyamino)imidazole ribonucleotide mutase [Methanohalobium sp.]|uniref:5-(carboxyamino)imidazole ribonucleotide mutase n=1 Tax=Methanohalobium sp. TaxID=2837493 RepID=UPI0025F4A70B|nr:5-(carboxyamino)imidazole ribonucleotide mutase [Methanohalobium sp.]
MVDVAIISGSESDKEIAEKSTKVLDDTGYSYDVQVISAHRNPDELDDYVTSSDAKVFITIAGLSAALPGVVASKTEKPVIGVPVNAKLGGLDALLSTAQMPPGVPVATVGIDNGKNAANLAIRILNMLK